MRKEDQMLAQKLKELDVKYGEVFRRDSEVMHGSGVPRQIQEQRGRLTTYLFEEVLANPHVFESLTTLRSSQDTTDSIVLTYRSQPGAARLRADAGDVSHYQFLTIPQVSPFPWLPDFLLLRDRTSSKVLLYVVKQGYSIQHTDSIGLDNDVKVSYEMRYQDFETGEFKVQKNKVNAAYVMPEELVDARFKQPNDMLVQPGDLFNPFYVGLETFAQKNLEALNQMRTSLDQDMFDRRYKILTTLMNEDNK